LSIWRIHVASAEAVIPAIFNRISAEEVFPAIFTEYRVGCQLRGLPRRLSPHMYLLTCLAVCRPSISPQILLEHNSRIREEKDAKVAALVAHRKVPLAARPAATTDGADYAAVPRFAQPIGSQPRVRSTVRVCSLHSFAADV
jgi:hypothetical protein